MNRPLHNQPLIRKRLQESLVHAGFDESEASALVTAFQAAVSSLASNAQITTAVTLLEVRMLKWFAGTALILVTIILAAIGLRW